MACQFNAEKTAIWLMQSEVDLNCTDKISGDTPLHKAARAKSFGIYKVPPLVYHPICTTPCVPLHVYHPLCTTPCVPTPGVPPPASQPPVLFPTSSYTIPYTFPPFPFLPSSLPFLFQSHSLFSSNLTPIPINVPDPQALVRAGCDERRKNFISETPRQLMFDANT